MRIYDAKSGGKCHRLCRVLLVWATLLDATGVDPCLSKVLRSRQLTKALYFLVAVSLLLSSLDKILEENLVISPKPYRLSARQPESERLTYQVCERIAYSGGLETNS